LESTKSVQEVKELAKLAPPVETMQPVPAPVVPVIKPPMNPPVSISAAGTPQNTRPPPAIPPAALPPSSTPNVLILMRIIHLNFA
jgi:hypothetical protein